MLRVLLGDNATASCFMVSGNIFMICCCIDNVDNTQHPECPIKGCFLICFPNHLWCISGVVIHHPQSCQGERWYHSSVTIKMILSFTDWKIIFLRSFHNFPSSRGLFFLTDILLPPFYNLSGTVLNPEESIFRDHHTPVVIYHYSLYSEITICYLYSILRGDN